MEGETDSDTYVNTWDMTLESGEGLERISDEAGALEAVEL